MIKKGVDFYDATLEYRPKSGAWLGSQIHAINEMITKGTQWKYTSNIGGLWSYLAQG